MISTILDADDISILDLHLHRVRQELLHFSCILRIKLAAITTQLFCKCLVICLKEPKAVDGVISIQRVPVQHQAVRVLANQLCRKKNTLTSSCRIIGPYCSRMIPQPSGSGPRQHGEDGRWRSEDSLYTPLQGPLGSCQRDAPTLPREEFCRGLVEAGKGLFAHS
jgi:hypothetical protein